MSIRLQKFATLDKNIALTKTARLNELPDSSLLAFLDIEANPQLAPSESVIFALHDIDFEVGTTYDFPFDFQTIDDNTKHVIIEEKINY